MLLKENRKDTKSKDPTSIANVTIGGSKAAKNQKDAQDNQSDAAPLPPKKLVGKRNLNQSSIK